MWGGSPGRTQTEELGGGGQKRKGNTSSAETERKKKTWRRGDKKKDVRIPGRLSPTISGPGVSKDGIGNGTSQ